MHSNDPWAAFGFEKLPVRKCKRHRYSSMRQEWKVDTVQVKLHPEVIIWMLFHIFKNYVNNLLDILRWFRIKPKGRGGD